MSELQELVLTDVLILVVVLGTLWFAWIVGSVLFRWSRSRRP